MTDSTRVVRQTIYYPYAWALAHAKGQVLDLSTEVAGYGVASIGTVPFLDVAGTFDPSTGNTALFILNRDLDKPRELTVAWRDGAPGRVLGAEVLTGRDLKAVNTLDAPSTVVPRALETPRAGPEMTFEVPARSYSVIRLAKS
jgi:alpha-L-arabinofuranosidase